MSIRAPYIKLVCQPPNAMALLHICQGEIGLGEPGYDQDGGSFVISGLIYANVIKIYMQTTHIIMCRVHQLAAPRNVYLCGKSSFLRQ